MAYRKPVPTLTPYTEGLIRQSVERLFKPTDGSYPYRNCLNCDHWNFDMDGCNKFRAKPPTDIIVYSCEQWEQEIPF